jgi:hypothetical protein
MAHKGGQMKNIITIVVVLVVGLVAYNYFSTGELKILPGSSMSQEEQEVNRLQGEFRRAAREFRQAARQAGIGGIDNTAVADVTLSTVAGVESDLELMRRETEDPEVRDKIDELLDEIKKFKIDIR